METLSIRPEIKTTSTLRERVRLGLTLAGILIAIICGLALMKEGRVIGSTSFNVPQLLETPRFAQPDFSSVKAEGVAIVSTILHNVSNPQ